MEHLTEMVEASETGFIVYFDKLPFTTSAHKFGNMWIFSGGAYNNREYFSKKMTDAGTLSELQ